MIILTYILFHVNRLNYILIGLIFLMYIPQVTIETIFLWFGNLKRKNVAY